VKIVNDITGHTTVVETQRDCVAVYFGLAKIMRRVNRRRDQTMKVSLHMLQDILVLHIHCPLWWGDSLAAESLKIAEPLREFEQIIWGKGGVI